jgi:hypothetical protein
MNAADFCGNRSGGKQEYQSDDCFQSRCNSRRWARINPRLLGHYSGVALSGTGHHLFTVSNAVDGFQVLDVSNPAAPLPAGEFNDGKGSQAGAISISGTYAYWAEPVVGLHVLDISDPAKPRQVGLYPIVLPESPQQTQIDGSW